jgi:hypothetical protein
MGNDRASVAAAFLLVVVEPGGQVHPGAAQEPLGWIPLRSSGVHDHALYASMRAVSDLLTNADYIGSPLAQRAEGLQQHLSAQALGRVVAHELGHFLLGTNTHTPEGLMRVHYRPEDLVDSSDRRFRLTPEDVARLQTSFRGTCGQLAAKWPVARTRPSAHRGTAPSVRHGERVAWSSRRAKTSP